MYVEVEVTPAGIEKITFNAEVDGYHSNQTMSEFMEQVRDAREVAFSAKTESDQKAVTETNVAPAFQFPFEVEDHYGDKLKVYQPGGDFVTVEVIEGGAGNQALLKSKEDFEDLIAALQAAHQQLWG